MKIFLWGLLIFVFLVLVLIFYAKSRAVSEAVFASKRILAWPQFAANRKQQSANLKIVTWNIGYASGDLNNQGSVLSRSQIEANLKIIAERLRDFDPDVVVLQEVDFAAKRSHNINQLEALAEALKMPYGAYAVLWNKTYVPYPYWPPSRHFGKTVSGQAVLSRLPIAEQTATRLPMPEKPFWYNWFYLDRIVNRVRLQGEAGDYDLWNVHLEAFDGRTRYEQAALLAGDVAQSASAYKILAGDFNDPTTEPGCGVVGEVDANAFVHFLNVSGFRADDSQIPNAPPTFPSVAPVDKLDHVVASPNLSFKSRQVVCTPASDHCLVFVELESVSF